MTVETKYKKGDTIYWYCDTDDEVHHEVETICCGERRTLFIEEDDVIDPNYM